MINNATLFEISKAFSTIISSNYLQPQSGVCEHSIAPKFVGRIHLKGLVSVCFQAHSRVMRMQSD